MVILKKGSPLYSILFYQVNIYLKKKTRNESVSWICNIDLLWVIFTGLLPFA